ncbi:hypothetical protein E2562_001316 [Oryza meyeriana var. granulata]|uniref:Uncharacterized protein n=1 Tax=Oryza meyeriana var. granulata TaxID=110450 RepID=A0A6G1DCC6_9ORYZ|nr:hypothetical protein E2562_001316 [Oryza meyeriana var. granulata]
MGVLHACHRRLEAGLHQIWGGSPTSRIHRGYGQTRVHCLIASPSRTLPLLSPHHPWSTALECAAHGCSVATRSMPPSQVTPPTIDVALPGCAANHRPHSVPLKI